jgi:TPR repeat protein
MRRLWPLLVILGCSAQPKPVATETAAPPSTPVAPTPAPAPTPAEPPAKVAVEEPPKSACDQDAASSECKCSQGVADSCFRLSESEIRRGNHDVAIARVLGMCQRGNPLACFVGAKYMARLHIDARLGMTPKDLNARGVERFEQACTTKVEDVTCVEYARLLMSGKYVAVDMRRGRELIEKACTAKQPRACLTLGNMYAAGQGVKKDKKRAIALLDQACSSTGGAACTALAEQLPASDRKRIVELQSRACNDDDADGCARAGAAVDAGGAGKDTALGRVAGDLLMKACDLGEQKSCVRAGELATDPVRAREAFETACDAEIFAGCAGLAPLVATGTGGPRHFGDGIALADKACKQKVPKACDLATQLRKTPPTVSCATIEACQPLCDEGIPSACKALAELELAQDPGNCFVAVEPLGRMCEAGETAKCVTAGNAGEGTSDSQRWYEIGCRAKQPGACTLHDAAVASHVTGKPRQAAVGRLKKACTSRDPQACAWYGNAITTASIMSNNRAAIAVLEKACAAGVGRACRWLSRLIDINPHYGIGDGSYQPFDAKLDKRVHELVERACKLGDRPACEQQLSDRGEDTDKLPAAPCGAEPSWSP